MSWKLTTYGKTRLGVTGVPWRDLSDDEFAVAESLFEPGVLRAREYFERVDDGGGQIASTGEPPYFEPDEAAESAPEPVPAPRARQRRSKR